MAYELETVVDGIKTGFMTESGNNIHEADGKFGHKYVNCLDILKKHGINLREVKVEAGKMVMYYDVTNNIIESSQFGRIEASPKVRRNITHELMHALDHLEGDLSTKATITESLLKEGRKLNTALGILAMDLKTNSDVKNPRIKKFIFKAFEKDRNKAQQVFNDFYKNNQIPSSYVAQKGYTQMLDAFKSVYPDYSEKALGLSSEKDEHNSEYWNRTDSDKRAEEFFANAATGLVAGDEYLNKLYRKYFPETFKKVENILQDLLKKHGGNTDEN